MLSYLKTRRKSDKISANTESSTRARGRADRRGVDVEDGEDGQRREGDGSNLVDAELLAREQVARDGDGEALQGVLNQALEQVGNIDSHGRGGGLCGGHLGLYLIKEKISLIISVGKEEEGHHTHADGYPTQSLNRFLEHHDARERNEDVGRQVPNQIGDRHVLELHGFHEEVGLDGVYESRNHQTHTVRDGPQTHKLCREHHHDVNGRHDDPKHNRKSGNASILPVDTRNTFIQQIAAFHHHYSNRTLYLLTCPPAPTPSCV